MTAVEIVRAALAEALALLLPVECAGCDEPDVEVCEACVAALAPHPRPAALAVLDVPVWTGLRFEDVTARVLRALKEDGRVGVVRHLAPALSVAVERVAGASDAADPQRRPILVVPVPTSRRAFRRRGFRVPDLIARTAGLRTTRALYSRRRVSDQRGLGRDARSGNVADSLVARGVAGRDVIVIDDVVTTGATLAEAVRALRAAGAVVLGAAAVASTPRRTAPLHGAFAGRATASAATAAKHSRAFETHR